MKIEKIIINFFVILMFALPVSASILDYDRITLNTDTYNYSPTPVTSGQDFEIWIQMTNKSNVIARNINYFLETDYPFILISEKEGFIETLAPHQSKIIKYKVRVDSKAITGTYDLELKYTREGVGIYNVKKYVIDVKGENAIVDLINSNINEISIGNSSKIYLDLKNLGRKNAKDIFITIDDSEDRMITVLGLKTNYIEKMDVGEEKQVSFKIDVSKDALNQTYTLPIKISFSDDDREHQISRSIGIKTLEDPKIILNVTDAGDNFKIRPNTQERVSIEIYNVGNVDTEMVYVTVKSPITNNLQEFIGSIEKDNYDNIDIRFNTGELLEESYPMIISVYYKDGSLKEQVITKEITLKTDTQTDVKSANAILMSVFGIIGFIIGLSILVLLLRWLFKILVKPAYKVVISIFKRK